MKAITLDQDDYLVYATVEPQSAETFCYEGRVLNAKRVRNRKRAAKGQKAILDIED